jgi:hypothetical protein
LKQISKPFINIMLNFNQIALLWIDAFNTHNIEALLSLYDDNAQHYSPKLKVRIPESKGLIIGKSAMREWWEDAFQRLPHLHYDLEKVMTDSEQIFIEYIRQNPGEEDMRVGETLCMKEGLIIASRVYHS